MHGLGECREEPAQSSMAPGTGGLSYNPRGFMRQWRLRSSLLLLPLVLSGCSVVGMDLTFRATRPTVAKRAVPIGRTVEAVPTPAFDMQAGNCPDAANRAIDLLLFAQRQSVKLDVRLELSPLRRGCGASGTVLDTYRIQVTSASLAAYVLDGSWAASAVSSRIELLTALVRQVHIMYPAAVVKVVVYQGDTVLGSVSLGMDNTPRVTCCDG